MVLELKFEIRKESDIFSQGNVYSVKSKFCFREAFKFNTKISVSLITHNGLKYILNRRLKIMEFATGRHA